MFSELSAHLPVTLGDFMPGAPIGDRAAWRAVPEFLKEAVVAEAEEAAARPWPVILASSWLAFTRNGDRAVFESLYFGRRRMLNALVLAELLEDEGRFLPAIVDGLVLICEESGWQLPAHNAYKRGGARLPLPDPNRPVIDLFAAETAAQFAAVAAMLGDRLDAIDPAIRSRIGHEVRRRIFEPYLSEHFWWMGRGDERMNNWTAWITQNVLLATFALPTDQAFRHAVTQKALASLDAFLKDYAEDGACEEGVLYYRHAALCLHGALTVLDVAAPGVFAHVWLEPKIRNMAEYIANMHVSGHFYFNFADSSAVVSPCTAREYLFGKAVGSDLLMDFAARDREGASAAHLPEEWSLWYRAQELLEAGRIAPPGSDMLPVPDRFYPGIGLFVARDSRFALAVKGGHNGESHNHNDVGSVTLYKGGKPFLIDVGVETYTAKTFSPQRYEIWTMQSAFHNLPDFGGVMQSDGAAFAARDVTVDFGAAGASISLDLAGAYPPAAALRSYRRTVRLVRGDAVEIEDIHEGDRAAMLSLMVVDPPVISSHHMVFEGLGTIEVEGAAAIMIEPIDITDARLRQAWPARIHRLRLPFEAGRLKLRIS